MRLPTLTRGGRPDRAADLVAPVIYRLTVLTNPDPSDSLRKAQS